MDNGTSRRLLMIGDLHFSLGLAPEDAAYALGRFLRQQAAIPAEAASTHLVLLGDIFDFDAIGPRDDADLVAQRASAAIADLAERDHPLLDALRDVSSAGWRIHVVAGNHDVEWSIPAVAEGFARAVGDSALVQVHPWILHWPRLAHLEHGHQYHDLNSLRRAADPFADGIRHLHLGAVLDDVKRRRTAGRLRERMTGGRRPVAATFNWIRRTLSHSERRARADYRVSVLRSHGLTHGLPEAATVALDAEAEVDATSMVRRLLGALRSPGVGTRGQRLMRRAATHVDGLLRDHGAAVQLLGFAHSHVAELEHLHSGTWYANPGRWTLSADGGYPFVEAVWSEGTLDVSLTSWKDPTPRVAQSPEPTAR